MDGKDFWYLSGLEVLCYILVNGGFWDVVQDGCMWFCYMEQNFDEGNVYL